MKRIVIATLLLLALCGSVLADVNLQFVVVQNDLHTGGNFDVKVQVASSSGSFNLGISNIVFTYNTAALSPLPLTVTPHNFSGGNYSTMTLSEPVAGRLSLNIVLNSTNNGTIVETAWKDVATIRFTIINQDLFPTLLWRTATPNSTVLFQHDNFTLLTNGTLTPLGDVSLPVALNSFSAMNVNGVVKLLWTTQSEQDNLGFNLFRSESSSGAYAKINGALIPGAGTSTAPRNYSFTDDRLENGHTYFYQLEDIDINGRITRHGPIEIKVESVQLPENFYVEQNYPNPFNPSTTIRFGLPEAASIRMQIYNMRGELVRTLVDGQREAGNLSESWDGTSDSGALVPTGIYICRIQNGTSHKSIKMLFAK